MASKNVIDIARDAAAVIGIEDFTTLVGNQISATRAILALLNRAGQNLSRSRNSFGEPWLSLLRESTFQTSPGEATYTLPEDYVTLVSDTVWDRSQFYEARGAMSPQNWQALRNGLVQTNVTLAPFYRIKSNPSGSEREMELYPTPTETRDLVFEYISNSWLRHPTQQTFYSRIQSDLDLPVIDSELLEMDLIWRFKQSRGLTFSAELGEFEMERDRRLAEDRGARAITIGRPGMRQPFPNVPLTGFGS